MIPDYNRVAGFYDLLAKLVFGDKLEQAKRAQLEQLNRGDKILVVGGGSGSLLHYIDALALDVQVDFVDSSRRMLAKARKRDLKYLPVTFINQNIIDHSTSGYDVIFTNFFFDQFDTLACQRFLEHLKKLAKPGARLLYADFILSKKLSDRIIEFFMYGFFRIVAKLGKVQLIDHKTIFLKNGLICKSTTRISSFIIAEAYIFP